MLENYEIVNYGDNILIKCKRCNVVVSINSITKNIVDIHDSYDIISQFLVLNGFKINPSKINPIDHCCFSNKTTRMVIYIGIGFYRVYFDNKSMLFDSSFELLDFLKKQLDIESMNKLTQIE